MPAVIAYIAEVLVEVGFSEAAAYFIAEVFVYVAATELINAVTQADASANANPGEGNNLTTNYTGTDASIRIVLGRIRAGGLETIPPMTTGGSGELLHKVITHAGHEVDSYGDAWLDDLPIPNASITAITGSAANDGMITTTKYANLIRFRSYGGSASDTNDAEFLLETSNSSFLGKGFAKSYLTYKWDKTVFKNVPAPSRMINGAKVYDPRLDSTNGGTGTHRYNDQTTWQFVHGAETYNAQSIGSNPALCLAWYLMHVSGGEVDPADIDWTTVITAANACDAQVNIPNGSGGSTQQDRYTCNGVLMASISDWTDNIKPLVDAMLGSIVFANGVWRMYAGGWQTPTRAIAKGDWVSGLQYTFDGGRDARFNRSRVFYIDADRNYTRQECYARSNATYKTADGNEDIDLVTQQLLCINEYEAQRKGEFLLRASRNQVMVSGRLGPKFQDILLWDTVTVTDDLLGWVSKTFRVVAIKHNQDGSLDVGLREEQDTDWTDLAYTDYNAPSTWSLPPINPTSPSEPQNFAVSQQLNGTLIFEWQAPIITPLGTTYRIIRSTNSANAAVGTVVWQGDANKVALVMPTSLHWYYVQAVANSLVSAYSPNTYGLIGRAIPEATHAQGSRPIPDPDISYSSENGVFWVTSNTNLFSLSLTGGVATGRIICKPSFGVNIEKIYSLPHLPYTRMRAGGYSLSMTAKMSSIGTVNSFGILTAIVLGWTGVGSPVIFSNAAPLFGLPNINLDYQNMGPVGNWYTVSQVGSILTEFSNPGFGYANPSSYPYLVVAVYPDNNGGASFNGVIDIDQVFFDYL
jgi:hypothetical protein